MLDEILSLPLERKIGQLFFIGLAGTEIDEAARALLAEISPGGVCLFARNVRAAAQTRRLLDDVRARCAVEPFLSLDQEGGLVDRLRRVVEPMPAASALKTPAQAARLGAITAEIVRILGFNMNFAPVVDVDDGTRARPGNGLYSRAYGVSKEAAAEFGAAYLGALQAGGVTGSIKHFPGLGAAETDSHENLPTIGLAAEDFAATDLYPYDVLLAATDVRAVMIAHAAYPRLEWQETDDDGRLLPASLSRRVTTGLLRDRYGFAGLALTDDLEMGAIVNNYGIGEACKMAVAAGQDQLLICNAADAIRAGYRAVLDAARAGAIDEARIDLSLQRIAAVKNLMQPPLAFDEARLEELSNEISDLKAQLK